MQQPKFKLFDKYDFIKMYVSTTTDEKVKAEKQQEAEIIANAILENQNSSMESMVAKLENLATKEDVKISEYRLMIRGGIFIAFLIGFAPKLWKFLEFGGL